MKKMILFVAEQRDGVLSKVAFELAGISSVLKGEEYETAALLMCEKAGNMPAELIAYGADKVIVIENKIYSQYITAPYASGTEQIVKKYSPEVLLIGATSIGRDFAPRVSARLATGLTADCTKLEMMEDGLHMTRPAFGGNLFATIVCPNHRPQMATVRPGVMKKNQPDPQRKGEIITENLNLDQGKVKVVKEAKFQKKNDNIEDAAMLVSVGRGVGTYLAKAKELANALGATLSSSRAMVDAGFTSPDRQVGQTGKTVRPQVYIALGISGAVQHLAGMEESDYIIAVNRDKTAPIFDVADLGIVGDVKQVIPQLLDKLSKRSE